MTIAYSYGLGGIIEATVVLILRKEVNSLMGAYN